MTRESQVGSRRRRRVSVALPLVLALLLFPPNGFPSSPAATRYWLAILAFDKNAIDIDAFRGRLRELDAEISHQFHDEKRCIWGAPKAEQACIEKGKIVPHCEALEIRWNETHLGHLSLWVEEVGVSPQNPPMGMIYEHNCIADATLSDCFSQRLTILAEEVHKHDQLCHTGGKCLVENKLFKPARP